MTTFRISGVVNGMNTKICATFLLLIASACTPGFDPKVYPNPDALYTAAMKEYNARRWENAGKAFEKLTTALATRDPRLPGVYFYLAEAQEKQGEHLLAATTFNRLVDAFPQDTLVDDALYFAGKAYEAIWRKPALDAQYGQSALTAFQSLQTAYPESPFAVRARGDLSRLDEWFATKDYDTGYLYLKRKAFDSAIIYFKDVIRLHPNAAKTREAYLRLLEAYRTIHYTEDARDLCATMLTAYPQDRETLHDCGKLKAAASK